MSGPRTAGEREAILDGELDESLAEFDGMLLKEQEVAAKRRESAAMGSSAGSGGTSRSDSFFDDETGEENRGESADAAGDTGHTADDAGEGAEPGAAAGKRAPGEGSGQRVPPDVGDGSDDDIIARQLREAAMAEEDPELREKLWQEYRDYKSGAKRKSTTKKKNEG